MKTLLLIDSNALIHRSFHALPPFTAPDGSPSGALYGLAGVLIKILRDTPPDFVMAFFDRPEPTFRKEMYIEYKIQRPKAPDELISQIIEAHNLFKIFGVKTFEAAGFEADDLIGAAAKKFGKTPDLQVKILTGDMDTLQLVVDDKVVVETLKKGISETVIYNEAAVKQRYEILPGQITDYKGLVGDTSDNIPGVKGVGPKTAAALINKYGTLEDFFKEIKNNPEKISANKAETKIFENKDIAMLSKKLATINTEAPLEIKNISEVAAEKIDSEKVIGYFKKFGFHSLIKRLDLPAGKNDGTGPASKGPNKLFKPSAQQSIFESSGLSETKQAEIPQNIVDGIEKPLTPILKEMNAWGIKISVKKLEVIKESLDGELATLTQKIQEESGKVFNINSPKQLLEILKNRFNLKITSTNYDKLIKFKTYAVIGSILRYRELFKLKTTYAEPLLELAGQDKNHRIHPTFVQLKAATGRITCENPNLQNVPPNIRRAFIAETGYKLAAFDYSQIELRILASITGDKNMLEAFEKKLDIHKITASKIFGISEKDVTDDQRKVAKTLNFGIVYGMGPRALAQQSGLSQDDAKKFIEEYFENFPAIKKWQQQVIKGARENGSVKNLNGRIRTLPEITSFSQRFQSEAERMAVNFPIQSLAADIIKLAMIKTKEKLVEAGWWETKAKMLLTIHDELVFEIKNDSSLQEIAGIIKTTMENVYKIKVPLTVNAGVGDNWEEI